jgi:small conductance mechanosensitive channel
LTLLLFTYSIPAATLFAETAKPTATETATESEKIHPDLDKLWEKTEKSREQITELQKRIDDSEGQVKSLLEVRLDRSWVNLLEEGVLFAEEVLKKTEGAPERNSYRQKAVGILDTQVATAIISIKRILSRHELPKADLSTAELAAAYAKIFRAMEDLNHNYDLVYQSLTLSEKYELDISEKKNRFKKSLSDRAENTSLLLDATADQIVALSASEAVLPDDADVKARLSLAQSNIDGIATALSNVLTLMENLEMNTDSYREQLLRVTGEITTDVFDIGVITRLLVGWWQSLVDLAVEYGPDLLIKVLIFCFIVFIARKIANIVQRLVERGLNKAKLELSELLRRMVINTARSVVMVFGVLIALAQAGISIGPLFAGLGVAGFVIGFALQDSLSNFASGVMILVYRPFDVGDLIEAAGVRGVVSHMSIVNTTILTVDNQTIILPNNKIWGDVIRNVTAQTVRRIDLIFGISYTDDIPKTERVLQEILVNDDKVLKNPEPMVRLHELGDSSVNFVVRPWVHMDDYWDVYWSVTRAVKIWTITGMSTGALPGQSKYASTKRVSRFHFHSGMCMYINRT